MVVIGVGKHITYVANDDDIYVFYKKIRKYKSILGHIKKIICCNNHTYFLCENNKIMMCQNFSKIYKEQIIDCGIIKDIVGCQNYILILNNENEIFKYDCREQLEKIQNFGIVKQIVGGENCAFVLNGENELWYTCSNNYEKIEVCEPREKLDFTIIDFDFGIIENIICGATHALIVNNKKQIFSFGSSIYDQCSNLKNFREPMYDHIKNIKKIICNRAVSYVVTNNNRLLTIGCNCYGALGIGTTVDSKKLCSINSNIGTIDNIYTNVSGDNVFVLNTDGELYGCGSNLFNSIGICNGQKNILSFTKLPLYFDKKTKVLILEKIY